MPQWISCKRPSVNTTQYAESHSNHFPATKNWIATPTPGCSNAQMDGPTVQQRTTRIKTNPISTFCDLGCIFHPSLNNQKNTWTIPSFRTFRLGKDDDLRPSSRRPSSLPGLASLDSQGADGILENQPFFIGKSSNITRKSSANQNFYRKFIEHHHF